MIKKKYIKASPNPFLNGVIRKKTIITDKLCQPEVDGSLQAGFPDLLIRESVTKL